MEKTKTIIEYVPLKPEIPEATLQPCPIDDSRVTTVKGLAKLATNHRQSAECANGKLEAVAEILEKDPKAPGPV